MNVKPEMYDSAVHDNPQAYQVPCPTSMYDLTLFFFIAFYLHFWFYFNSCRDIQEMWGEKERERERAMTQNKNKDLVVLCALTIMFV